MKKISVRLDEKSIAAAIKEVKAYKQELYKKVQNLIQLMLDYGEDYALNEVGHVDTGETLTTVIGHRNGTHGVIVAGGNAIWLEFGTGIRNNGPAGSSPHPKGEEFGMKIGEYGKGQGSNPNGWWYYDGDRARHTYGIKANLFMWRTARELERVAPELAKRVFYSGR